MWLVFSLHGLWPTTKRKKSVRTGMECLLSLFPGKTESQVSLTFVVQKGEWGGS